MSNCLIRLKFFFHSREKIRKNLWTGGINGHEVIRYFDFGTVQSEDLDISRGKKDGNSRYYFQASAIYLFSPDYSLFRHQHKCIDLANTLYLTLQILMKRVYLVTNLVLYYIRVSKSYKL